MAALEAFPGDSQGMTTYLYRDLNQSLILSSLAWNYSSLVKLDLTVHSADNIGSEISTLLAIPEDFGATRRK